MPDVAHEQIQRLPRLGRLVHDAFLPTVDGIKHSDPEHPRNLSGRAWSETLKRTGREFQDDNLTDRAAALTYYGVLALFPALIALVSIVGLFGDPEAVTDTLTDIIDDLAPGSASDTLSGTIEDLTEDRGAAGVLLVLGTLGALNAASGYIGAFIRASNVIYEVEEGRPFFKLRPLQLGRHRAHGRGRRPGHLGHGAQRPPGRVGRRRPGHQRSGRDRLRHRQVADPGAAGDGHPRASCTTPRPTPGSPACAGSRPAACWRWSCGSAASALFALYVSNFGSYNKTYGTLGGAVTFLVWLWITNIAVLLGAELNAELERSREIEVGVPGAEEELQLPPRQEARRGRSEGAALPCTRPVAGEPGQRSEIMARDCDAGATGWSPRRELLDAGLSEQEIEGRLASGALIATSTAASTGSATRARPPTPPTSPPSGPAAPRRYCGGPPATYHYGLLRGAPPRPK